MGNYINQENHSHGHDDYDDLSKSVNRTVRLELTR